MSACSSPLRHRALGFTLLEILVAVAIFAIIGLLALGGYNELVKQSEALEETASRTRAVQAAVHRLVQDFAMLEPRPVRDVLGDSRQPALVSDDRTDRLVELTRSSWTNPAGVPRSTLQRVSYRLDDGKLRREYWSALDRTLTAEPASAVLLDDVRSMRLRFLDQNLQWQEQWPPLRYSGPDAARVLPVAVEIRLELEDWGEIVRLVEVSG